jgi:hypothetical protein
MTGEVYLILVNNLINYFEMGQMVKIDYGLNTMDVKTNVLLRKVKTNYLNLTC